MTHIIGLTGGIASGKSTVAQWIRAVGFEVVDADQLVHDLQQKGGALHQVLVDWLGETILTVEGELNRKSLSEQLFAHPERLAEASRLQAPIIRQALADERDRLIAKGKPFFMDIPLLFEQGYQDWCDEIWLVYAPWQRQLERLMARNQYSREEALQRMDSQMSIEEKRAKASLVIDNSGNLEHTQQQVQQLLVRLHK